MTTREPEGGAGIPRERDGVGVGRAFDHVGLTVPDLQEAIDFFTDAFGARLEFRMDRAGDGVPMGTQRLGVAHDSQFSLAMLELGNSRIELLQWWPERSSGAPPEADMPGGSHVAIEVGDVAAALELLAEHYDVRVVGAPMSFEATATPGLTNAFVLTPWGSLVELLTWRRSRTQLLYR